MLYKTPAMYHNNTIHFSTMNDFELVTIAAIVLTITFAEEMFDVARRKLLSYCRKTFYSDEWFDGVITEFNSNLIAANQEDDVAPSTSEA